MNIQPRRIQILDSQLANQIAAGEVIERPASVVKELLENSLDAGATEINFDIKQAGIGEIKLKDNGAGIVKEDLALAVSRHGTSKITNYNDLEQVTSLGFRGEALASIGSVSRLQIQSRPKNQDEAWQLSMNGREDDAVITPCSHPFGTTIIVNDLFYNTPARRKFLRVERTEFTHLETMIKRLALSRFDLRISLQHNERKIFSLTPALDEVEKEQRIAKLLGKNFINNALKIDFNGHDMRIWGWISQPGYTLPHSNHQLFYVNGRMVRDKIILHALKTAYQGHINQGDFPAFLLFFEIEPQLVDVNVHPTKHEVRFREQRLVHDFILNALNKSLAAEQIPMLTDIEFTTKTAEEEFANSKYHTLDKASPSQIKESVGQYQRLYEIIDKPNIETKPTQTKSPVQFVAVVQQQFIIAQLNEEIILIDALIAQQESIEEQLIQRSEKKQLTKKPLLFPYQARLNLQSIQLLEHNKDLLNSLGIELEVLSTDTIVLRQAAVTLEKTLFADFIAEICEILQAKDDLPKKLFKMLAKYAARSQPITTQEQAIRLIQQLDFNSTNQSFIKKLSTQQFRKFIQIS